MHIEKDFNFVILMPEMDVAGLRMTTSSIKANFPNVPYICAVGNSVSKTDLKPFGATCPFVKCGNTITSLINLGVKNSPKNWCFIVVAGNFIRNSLLKKYIPFLNSDKDILYAVRNMKTWLFEDATINGMLMNKKCIEEVGDFSDEENIAHSKLFWSVHARDNGYTLKGIVGIKI